MVVSRVIGTKRIGVDPNLPVGILLREEEQQTAPEFANVLALVNWARTTSRVPGTVQWELLSACNFKCPFCYIVGHTQPKKFAATRATELIEEFVSAGVLHVILTGGEPLLHPAFPEIYAKLKHSGIIVTVFTNLELLTDDVIDLFRSLPPYGIEVSVYGRDEESYERATRRPTFSRVIQNIEKLKRLGINLVCKTPVTTVTAESIAWISEWCAAHAIPYVTTPNINDGLDGATLAQFSLTGDSFFAAEARHLSDAKKVIPLIKTSTLREQRRTFSCGAGKVGAYVNYDGTLSPCFKMRDTFYDLAAQTFGSAWQRLSSDVVLQEGLLIEDCDPDCRARPICKMCPARALRDGGLSYRADPDYCHRTIETWDHISAH